MNSRDRVLAMVHGLYPDRLPCMPITMMFAGDFAGVRYGDYATHHEVLAAAQLKTAAAFGFDHVSVISDPAREAADCGAQVAYFPDQPPAIDECRAVLADAATLVQLKQPDPLGGGRMHDRVRGVARLKEGVGDDLAVEGWVEGPCAEGADLRGINRLMLDFMDEPAFVRDLFDFVITMELRFAKAQVQAGADLIGVGDAAASLAGPAIYREFIWPAEKRLIDGIHAMGALVRLHICGNTGRLLDDIGRLGADIVDLDYPVSVAAARAAMAPDRVLLGNLHPVQVVRDGTPASIRAALAQCHREAGPWYIVGAGCEIPRGTPAANVKAFAAYAASTRRTGGRCLERAS